MDLEQKRNETIQHLREIRKQFLSSIEGLTEAQMSEPSIDGWSVKDHLNHLAFWHDLRSSEVVRISAGYEHAWPLTIDSQAVNDIVQPARARLATLGVAVTSRIGFWLWYALPIGAFLTGDAEAGALIYGTYAAVRAGAAGVILGVGRRLNITHNQLAEWLMGKRVSARLACNSLLLTLAIASILYMGF